ncbi:hypothetical protein BDF19DRAFT_441630, partial [Syncephalis fuscata]
MRLLDYRQSLLVFPLLFICISVQLSCVAAKLTIVNNTGNKTYDLHDNYPDRESYYQYEGIGLVWSFKSVEWDGPCAFPPVDAFDKELQDIAKKAYAYSEFALVLDYSKDLPVECSKGDNMIKAVNSLISQLSRAAFPTIKLIIIAGSQEPIFMIYYDNIELFNLEPYHKTAKTESIKTAKIGKYDSLVNDLPNTGSYKSFHYIAEQELNPWDAELSSAKYITHELIYFVLLLLAFLYACFRVFMLVTLKMLKYNLLLLSFGISVIYCISFMSHLIALRNTYDLPISLKLYIFIAGIPFDIIFWHWSTISKNLFSKRTIILFRIFIVIDIIPSIIRIFLEIVTVIKHGTERTLLYSLKEMHKLITIPVAFINCVVFCGFVIWFILSAYRLKKYSKGRKRFIQLACVASLGLVTYMAFPLRNIWPASNSFGFLFTKLFVAELLFDTAFMIRALIFLSVLGVRWPRPPKLVKEEIRSPLGGMTTVGGETMVRFEHATDNHPSYRRLTRKFTRMIKRYSNAAN